MKPRTEDTRDKKVCWLIILSRLELSFGVRGRRVESGF